MMGKIITLVYLVSLATLFYAAFCRISQTDKDTHLKVRAAFWFLASAAAFGVFSVLFWNHPPAAPEAALALAMAGVQLIAARLWRFGVPRSYRR